jgi:hypothetical protein
VSTWRVGEHYGIHVYEGDRPVATFHDPRDATLAIQAVNHPLVALAARSDELEGSFFDVDYNINKGQWEITFFLGSKWTHPDQSVSPRTIATQGVDIVDIATAMLRKLIDVTPAPTKEG